MNFQEMERGLGNALHSGLIGSQQAVQKENPILLDADDTLVQANAIAMRIMGLADRLCGTVPVTNEAAGTPQADGLLNQFRAHMRDTRQALIYADEALNRIERELVG